jgi:hypothetical protein
MAADSTMLRMVKRLIALSFGVHRLQLEQRIGFTWPRPFLFRPLLGSSVLLNAELVHRTKISYLDALFLTIFAVSTSASRCQTVLRVSV